ncbi:MAG TPA: DnaD domain protein, partial [Dehalococcoidia bacterium]|nr:DnaD domain protein [Dehalococcoidia bacterium]
KGHGSRAPHPLNPDLGPRFGGFPSSGLATAVPNLFFSRVLPQIEQREELVVSVYFFFASAVGGRRRSPRFVTKSELAADGGLLRALASLCGGQDGDALARGLHLAVARGTLLRATVEAQGRQEELYLLNTPAGRRALAELAERELAIDEPLPAADGSTLPNIFALYEENVGSITPLIAEELKDAEERYPPAWIVAAFREAMSLNKRSWRYIHRILRRWEAEGPDYEEPEGHPERDWLERRYAAGKRRRAGRA